MDHLYKLILQHCIALVKSPLVSMSSHALPRSSLGRLSRFFIQAQRWKAAARLTLINRWHFRTLMMLLFYCYVFIYLFTTNTHKFLQIIRCHVVSFQQMRNNRFTGITGWWSITSFLNFLRTLDVVQLSASLILTAVNIKVQSRSVD